MLQEVLRVTAGRQDEATLRLAWIHNLMKPNPGFVRAQVARFQNSETDHLILRIWESLEAFQAFRQTPDGQGYSRNRPEGLYEGLPVGRGWELLGEAKGKAAGPGAFMLRRIGKVEAARKEAFIAGLQKEPLAADSPGLVSLQVWRCLDETPEHKDTFLVLGRHEDQGSAKLTPESSPFQLDDVTSTDLCELAHDTLP